MNALTLLFKIHKQQKQLGTKWLNLVDYLSTLIKISLTYKNKLGKT